MLGNLVRVKQLNETVVNGFSATCSKVCIHVCHIKYCFFQNYEILTGKAVLKQRLLNYI